MKLNNLSPLSVCVEQLFSVCETFPLLLFLLGDILQTDCFSVNTPGFITGLLLQASFN